MGMIGRLHWELGSRARRLSERAALFVAFRLAPRWLAYWCAIRVWAHGTTGPYGTTEASALTLDEALRRWQSPAPPGRAEG
jgi:hypothetical protein